MRKINFKHLVVAGALIITIAGCKKDNSNNNNTPSPTGPNSYATGVFISCEGPFQNGTGTVSFLDRSTKTIYNDIFQKVNNRPLGNVVQSINIINDNAYIVVNNAAKIEVVYAATFVSIGVIKGLTSPRFIIGITDSKAYVSDWSNNIDVINLSNNSLSKTIAVANGPEQMLKYNNKVFVLNAGGWGTDSTLSVIDCNNDILLSNVTIYPVPTGICLDRNNKLWILCSGKGYNGFTAAGDSKGHLLRVNPDNYTVEKDFEFPATDKHPQKLVISSSQDMLYYNYTDGIYSFDINAVAINTVPLVKLSKIYYSLGFDTKVNMLYATDPADYVQNGWLLRFSAATGTKVDSFRVGVIPGNYCFN